MPIEKNIERLQSIDALRGLVILIMLLDHVRETFYLHKQVTDPMDVTVTEPALFGSRLLAHICAPVFVLLTGISAFLFLNFVYFSNTYLKRACEFFLDVLG